MINFLELADRAAWESRQRLGRNTMAWAGAPGDSLGFVNQWPGSVNEVGGRGDFLVVSPRGGSLKGVFPRMTLPENAQFLATVGFLQGTPDRTGAIFEIKVWYEHEGQTLRHRVFSVYKERDSTMTSVVVDLSFLGGREVQLEISVSSVSNSLRDVNFLPIWSAPRIEEREPPFVESTRFFEIRPVELTVNDWQERSGGGDDPFLALIYLRSTIGAPGSTLVEVMDLLSLLGKNVDSGETIAIDDSAFMVVRDIGLQGGLPTLASAVFVALEEDKRGRGVIREALHSAATQAALYLDRTAERNLDAVLRDPLAFIEGLKDAMQGEGGGGGSSGFAKWIGRAHDLIGFNAVTLVFGPAASLVDATPDITDFPIGNLEDGNYQLDFEGEGAHWTLTVEVRVVDPGPTLAGNPCLFEMCH